MKSVFRPMTGQNCMRGQWSACVGGHDGPYDSLVFALHANSPPAGSKPPRWRRDE